MASKQQQTGMQGVYSVAAEIAGRGFVVSPTSRSAIGADLLVTNHTCRRAYSVQVKTNAGNRPDWLLSEKAKGLKSSSHIYVFVNLRAGKKSPEYFVVPSRVVAARMRRIRRKASTWYWFPRVTASRYQDRWAVFGSPNR